MQKINKDWVERQQQFQAKDTEKNIIKTSRTPEKDVNGASCKLPPVRTTQAVKAKTPRCLFIWQNNKLNPFSISSLFTLSDSCVPPPLWGDFVEVLRLLHHQTRSEPPWPQGCSPSWWTVYETKVLFQGWSPTWAGPPTPPSPSLPFSLSASSPSTWLPGNLRKEDIKELLYT